MRILLAAKFVPSGPRPIGGVQSWIATVRAELERRGHAVTEWQPGFPAPAPCDLGVLANWTLTGHLQSLCRRVVNVSHGIIPPEAPGPADVTVYVSEGVRAHWRGAGEILRQPIDLAFWTPGESPRQREAVRFSYRHTETPCAEAAAALGLSYRHLCNVTPAEARAALRSAGVVFASGRAALEAMACGAPVVICDHRASYQGPLMDTDLGRQMANSYSGRGGWTPTPGGLVKAAREALPRRDWVETHHDAARVVDRLLCAA